jgi:hypothetical protein
MTNTADRVTRVAADLMDSATVEGARQNRSAKQQLDHWARVGREVSSHRTAAWRRVEAALTGDLELRELSVEEGAVFNAEIAAAVQEKLPGTKGRYSPSAASRPWLFMRTVTSSSTALTLLGRADREPPSGKGWTTSTNGRGLTRGI